MKSLTIKTLAVALTLAIGNPVAGGHGELSSGCGADRLEEIRLGPLYQTNQQAVKHEHPR
jgi:hypothetical protein